MLIKIDALFCLIYSFTKFDPSVTYANLVYLRLTHGVPLASLKTNLEKLVENEHDYSLIWQNWGHHDFTIYDDILIFVNMIITYNQWHFFFCNSVWKKCPPRHHFLEPVDLKFSNLKPMNHIHDWVCIYIYTHAHFSFFKV